MIRVLVASDYPMVRAGLLALLDGDDEIAVVADTASGAEMVRVAADMLPDLVLLDLADHDSDVADLAAIIEAVPATSVIVLSGDPSGSVARQALVAGARGYLFKEASKEDITAAVRTVQQGLIVLHPAAARLLLEVTELRPGVQPQPGETLTGRELEVLALVAQGLPNKTIAFRLHLSEHTIKFHVASIIGKLSATSRTEAVTLAARQGLITL